MGTKSEQSGHDFSYAEISVAKKCGIYLCWRFAIADFGLPKKCCMNFRGSHKAGYSQPCVKVMENGRNDCVSALFPFHFISGFKLPK